MSKSELKRLLVALPECLTPGAKKKVVTVRRMPFEPFREVSTLDVPVDALAVAVDVVVGAEVDISVVAQNTAGAQSAPVALNLTVSDPLPPSLGGGVEICGEEECVANFGDKDLIGLEIFQEESGGDAGPG